MDHKEAERIATDIIYRWEGDFPAGGPGALLHNLLFVHYTYLLKILKDKIVWVLVSKENPETSLGDSISSNIKDLSLWNSP